MARRSTQRRLWLVGTALVLLGADAVPFVLDLEGRRIEILAPTNGARVVLHFWATWCPGCLEDLRGFQQASAECTKDQVRVFAIDVGDSVDAVDEFLSEHALTRAVVRDPDSEVWRSQRVRGLPATVFWSTSERRVEVGPKQPEEWLAVFRSLGCSAASLDSPPNRSRTPGSD